MAGTAKKSPPKLKLISGRLEEEPAEPKKEMTLGKAFIASAKSWSPIFGLGILLTAGAIGLRYVTGDEKRMTTFSMVMNLEEIVAGGGNNSGITDLAMQNLESMEKIGGEELLLLRRAIERMEAKCRGECEPLINRMKVLQKKWERRIDSRRPISDLRWRGPGLKNAPLLRRAPQKLARSRC